MFDYPFLTPLLLTLKIAGAATLVALAAGLAMSGLVSRRSFFGRDLLDVFCTLPLVLPPTVLGYYLLILVGRRGFLGRWLWEMFQVQLIFTWQGAVFAASIAAFPLVYKSARTGFESVDCNLENAARTLGASEWGVFFRVSLPLAWKSVLAGALLAYARSMGEFGATLMVAGNLPGKTQTLSLAVFEAVQAGHDDLANLLVVIASVVCAAILYGAGKLLKH